MEYDARQTKLERIRSWIGEGKCTADGVEITDGLPVWDYNLRPGYVDLMSLGSDGWFDVRDAEGHKLSLMNAARVCVRHPHTGATAKSVLEMK